jgi:leucyl aminopeptidase
MKVEHKKSTEKDHLICLFLMEGEKASKELIPHRIKEHHFQGKLAQTFTIDAKGKHMLTVGLGKKSDFRIDNLRIAAGVCVKYAETIKEKEFSIYLPKKIGEEEAQAITEGAILSGYKFHQYKSSKEDLFEVDKVHIVTDENVSKGIRAGMIFANAQNYARELDEHPSNIATPTKIAKEARKLAKEKKFNITVYDKKKMQKMGMQAILGVARGSAEPPVLVKLEYNKGKRYPLYSLVGKGITFDAGGISLKSSRNMHEMKYDKTGAINVLGVFKAVAELKLPIRLLGLLPLSENTPSGSAQKPGDIVKAYSGKTIEVLNTDAEGRLVLADALSYAVEQKPEYIIDMATLTGAMVIALGRHAIGLFSNDDKLAKTMIVAGEETHERVWRMPLWPEYGEMMKSDFADLKNISELPEAGSITAAAFLKEFIGDIKWAHLDIAAVEMAKGPQKYFSKGATGIGVRLVTRTLQMLANKKK